MSEATLQTTVKKHALALGWMCLLAGVGVMVVSLWLFFVYGLLCLAAFAFGITAIIHKRILTGVCLLLALFTALPTLWLMLSVYRGASAVDRGLSAVQRQAASSVAESRRQQQQSDLEQAAAQDVKHRRNSAFGAWAVTMWNAQGDVLQNSEAIGGFERCDAQMLQFSVPVDQNHCRYRVFTIVGPGTHGEWSDEPASGFHGGFEIGSRPDGKPMPDRIGFTWNETSDEAVAVPRKGIFTRSQP